MNILLLNTVEKGYLLTIERYSQEAGWMEGYRKPSSLDIVRQKEQNDNGSGGKKSLQCVRKYLHQRQKSFIINR